MKEKLTVSAKQIEWSEAITNDGYTYYLGCIGEVPAYTLYEKSYVDCIWVAPRYDYFDDMSQDTFSSIDQAKQACQAHLQQYVDGLLLQLQQLTEIENED